MSKNKTKSIAISTITVSIMMMIFKLLGFVKQSVIAYYFGANQLTDIYNIAYGFMTGIVDAIVQSVSVSIVAVYTNLLVTKGKEKANELISGILEVLMPTVILLITMLCVFAPYVAKMLAPSYDYNSINVLVKYIYAVAPFSIFCVVILVFTAVSDSNKKFFIPRMQSLVYSMITILMCIVFADKVGINTLIYAQYISYIVFCVILIFSIRKIYTFRLVKIKEIKELKKIMFTAIPLFIGNAALQINEIVDKAITSGLEEGATSALAYCHILEQFVSAILIANIGSVLFAHFAEYVSMKNYCAIENTLNKAINILICMLSAVSVITIVCAKDIVTIVYYRGSFSNSALELTSIALIAYALNFPFAGVRELTVKSLYAFSDTNKPMTANIVAIVVNVILSIIFAKYIGIFGVAIATSISVIIAMFINIHFLKKHLNNYRFSLHLKTVCKVGIAAIILLCWLLVLKSKLAFSSIVFFVFSCLTGIPIYILVLYVLNVEEIMLIFSGIRQKLKKGGK